MAGQYTSYKPVTESQHVVRWLGATADELDKLKIDDTP